LNVGGAADLCIFDPQAEWSVTQDALRSQGKHTPFAHDMSGSLMPARVKMTIVNGQIAFGDLN
jgi:dihydroorotase